MDDFSQHPPSITEIRANRSQSCAEWTPRDALIDLLRRIDAGETDVDALVISYRERTADGLKTRFNMVAPDSATGLGLLARVSWMINEG